MNILVIGGGAMGQSFIGGFANSNHNAKVYVVEHSAQNASICQEMGVTVFQTVSQASETVGNDSFEVCVIAVKPADVTEVCTEISSLISPKTLVVSIAAGVSLASLAEVLNGFPIVRAMPNIAASQQLSATAMSCSPELSEREEMKARTVLETLGSVARVNEEHMNAVTAISGSGPAYIFLIAEYLSEIAQELGLSVEVSHQLIVQTLLGAAALSDGTGSFAVLRDQVTSPGGTTEAAIKSFEAGHLREVIESGVRAAASRASELDS